MTPFERDVIALLSGLRRYARSLAISRADAEDLAQETMLKALAHRDQFAAGTSLGAWLCVIMRNTYWAQFRKAKRFVADPDGIIAMAIPQPAPDPDAAIDARRALRALALVPARQREALVRLGRGDSYEEIAAAQDVSIGTVKSRIHRGREEFAAAISR